LVKSVGEGKEGQNKWKGVAKEEKGEGGLKKGRIH
jgi:hypothetical protein